MHINIGLIKQQKETLLHFKSDFKDEKFKMVNPLKEVHDFDVDLSIYLFDSYLNIKVKGVAKVSLISSYTLKVFDKEIDIDDELEFTLDKDNYDYDYISTNEFEIDEYLFALLVASIPMVVYQEGETLPKGEGNYRVLSSKEYEEEEKLDPRLSKLDDIDID